MKGFKSILSGLVFFLFSLINIKESCCFSYYEHKFIGDVAFYNAINNKENKELFDNLEKLFSIDNKITEKVPQITREQHPFDKYENLFAKNNFQNVNLFHVLLKEGIIQIDNDNPDYAYFNESIKTTDQLKKRLQEVYIIDSDIALILAIWHQSQIGVFLRNYKFFFGDLVAMGGDHYGKAEDIANLVTIITKTNGKSDQKFVNILEVVNYQFENVEKWYRKLALKENFVLSVLPDCYETSNYEKELFVYLPDFSRLARSNETHFGDGAWKTWQENHKKALEYAFRIARKRICEKLPITKLFESCQTEIIAMVSYEGFAQHFLQDAFAAGHIRTVRKTWFYPPVISEHEHNYDNSHGLHVKMEMPCGEEKYWKSYGDNCLFTPRAKENIEKVIEISSWSLNDIFDVAFNENFESTTLCNTNETKIEKLLSERGKTIDNLKRPLVTDVKTVTKPPPYRWQGMSYAMTFMFRESDFRSEEGALRLDVGYEYGRSPFYWVPFNYLGAAVFLFPGDEKSFHFVLGSASFLSNNYYPSWNRIDAWTGLIFVDKWFLLALNKFKLESPLGKYSEAVKLETKISGGPYYFTENDNVHLRTELIYNFSASIKIYSALNLRISSDLLWAIGKGEFFLWRGFYRTGVGIEFVF